MANHEVIHFELVSPGGVRLIATIRGFPAWLVRAHVVAIDGLATLAELTVYPMARADLEAWQDLDRVSDPELGPTRPELLAQVVPTPRGESWSGDVQDVPSGGIVARVIRTINVGELIVQARRCAAEDASRSADGALRSPRLAPRMAIRAAQADHLVRSATRTGRRGNGVDHYLEWACSYAALTHAGELHPIARLAKETGESVTYVRDTITDARRRYGLLTSAGRGRAGGHLTDKAFALLRDATVGVGDGG